MFGFFSDTFPVLPNSFWKAESQSSAETDVEMLSSRSGHSWERLLAEEDLLLSLYTC